MAERTFKQIVAGQRRSLQAHARKLRKMGDEWADRDEGNIEMLYALAGNAEATADALYTGEED